MAIIPRKASELRDQRFLVLNEAVAKKILLNDEKDLISYGVTEGDGTREDSIRKDHGYLVTKDEETMNKLIQEVQRKGFEYICVVKNFFGATSRFSYVEDMLCEDMRFDEEVAEMVEDIGLDNVSSVLYKVADSCLNIPTFARTVDYDNTTDLYKEVFKVLDEEIRDFGRKLGYL